MTPNMKRRVLITGAARGIGKSIAEQFSNAGFELVTPTRQELDLASTDSVQAYLRKNASLEIDVLVNNAGENKINSLQDMPLEDWQRILTVNLTSVFLLTQGFAPGMMKRRWGRIVNVSTIYSHLARPGRAAYSASKSGLNGLTRTAALEYGEQGVLVNAVCPGFVETELTRKNNSEEKIRELASQTALKRMAQPDEIARFTYFLGSELNTYITGQTLTIDGGFSIQ